jgi:uncharacterized protein YhbP (UPF0306 family)
MTIKRSDQPVPRKRIERLLRDLLEASTLCAIATVTRGGSAYINTAYFTWTPDYRLVWLSAPGAWHSRNLRANSTAAIAVFDSHQVWGKPDRGLQVFGSARELGLAGLKEVEEAYRARFPGAGPNDLIPYRFYALRPRRVKLFDERTLGPGIFVTARVRADGLVQWERTEVYEGRDREMEHGG